MKKLMLVCLAALTLASCARKLTLNDYTIILPAEPTDVEVRAASELQRYLKAISGAELPIVSDATEPAPKEILIGATNRGPFDNLDKLGKDGFVIRTLGEKLFIQGGPRRGTIYGVYELIESYFGVRHYSRYVEHVPQRTRLKIPAKLYDEQIPAFGDLRYVSGQLQDTTTNDWLRSNMTPDGLFVDWGLFVHTFDLLLPHKWFETHPEYFALVKGRRAKTQPCLSNPAVLEIICENLAREIEQNPEAIYWSVSSNDNFQYCECDDCAAIDAEEGGPTGSVIRFVNRVAERFPDKQISTLAYQYTRQAPTKTRPLANVNIMFCNIECNRAIPLADDPGSADFRKDMEDWARLTHNILVWDYAVSFNELQRPFPNLFVLQPNIRYFDSHGVEAFFELCAWQQGGEFVELRSYLISKLAWNPHLDFEATLTDFLNGYYGKKAAPYIRRYIDLITKNMEEAGEFLGTQRYCIEYKDSWLSDDKVKQYKAIMDQAVAAAADDEEVQTRVRIARAPVCFAELELSRSDPYGPRGFLEERDGKWVARQWFLDELEEFTAMTRAGLSRTVTEHHSTPEEYRTQMLRMADIQQEGNLAYRKPVSASRPLSEKRDINRQGLQLLTDGLRGTQIWTSQWLGYYQPEVEFIVDLEEVQTVSHIDSDHLQILWESAFLPERIEAFTSTDGKTFTPAGPPVRHVVNRDPFFGTQQYDFDFAPRPARYVKVKVNSLDICPVWHYYSGDDALMFIGEIVVR